MAAFNGSRREDYTTPYDDPFLMRHTVERLRDEAKDLRSAIERRDEIIDGLKVEVKRLREKAAIEASRAWSEERGFNHNCLTIEEKEAHD